MAPCLIAMRFVPDDSSDSVPQPCVPATSEFSGCDTGISDEEERAELKMGVGFLVVLGIAPILIFLVAYCIKPELLKIDITPVTNEHDPDAP